MRNVLITGGSGFIGRYFVERLRNERVRILDLRAPDYNSHAEFVQGDVRKVEDLRRALDGVDLIINLAAMHHDFGIREEEYFETNVGGATNIADLAASLNIFQIINFSSVAVYGNQGNPGPTTESTVPQPTAAYGKSKLEAEQTLNAWAASDSRRKLLNVRTTVVFGPHNLANVLSLIIAIDKGFYIHIGKDNVIKSLSYVENLVDASLFAFEKHGSGSLTINYSDEPHMSSHAIARLQAKLLGKKIPVHVSYRIGYLLALPFDFLIWISGKNFKISTSRIRKFCTQTYHSAPLIRSMGFIPKYTIEYGMARMIEWYRSALKNR